MMALTVVLEPDLRSPRMSPFLMCMGIPVLFWMTSSPESGVLKETGLKASANFPLGWKARALEKINLVGILTLSFSLLRSETVAGALHTENESKPEADRYGLDSDTPS